MARYFSQEFKCTECDTVQDQLVENAEHNAESNCNVCNAPPDKLVKEISATNKHLSWSKWNAMG